MYFYVSNLFTLIIHTDWCSILFSSHRGLTSSCRSRRSQDGYQYEKISISVWKILEGFGLYDEFIYLPHFHEIYSKTSLLIETYTLAILTLITRWHLSLLSTGYFLPIEKACLINRFFFFSKQITNQGILSDHNSLWKIHNGYNKKKLRANIHRSFLPSPASTSH